MQTNGAIQTWVQRGNDLEGAAAGDLSGTSIDLSNDGNIVAIGSPDNDSGATNSGHVRVFEWVNNNWIIKGNAIVGSGNPIGEKIGSDRSVSLNDDGTILATGGRYFDSDRGRVSVYKYKGTTTGWQKRGSDLIIPDKPSGQAGAAVDLDEDGTSIIIGAPFVDNPNGTDAGRAAVLDW